ncbi:hypothetical protein F5Y12DRAFT_778657 [Xylaria sp. FL1777]|nr:hypothetical protein F5Y12DRAFT_778657 [Xylaria sp. FL1777]
MQVKALIVSLFLAATVAAAPFGQKDSETPNLENAFNNIGNGENNPSLGSHDGNNNGNNNGNGNTIGSNNQFTEDNKFLNDFLNVNYGATGQQVSQVSMMYDALMDRQIINQSPLGSSGSHEESYSNM